MTINKNGILILQNSRILMKNRFIWPPNGEEDNPSKRYYLSIMFMIVFSCSVINGNLVHLVNSGILNGQLDNIDMDIISILSLTGCLFFICNVVYSIRKFINVLRVLSDMKIYGKPEGFDELNEKLNNYSKMFTIYMFICLLIVGFSSSVKVGYCFDKPACGLFIPSVMPFDTDHYPGKLINFILKIMALTLTYNTTAILSFAILEVLEHIIFRLEDVKKKLAQALMSANPNRDLDLEKAIDYHNFVIDVSQEYNEAIKWCMFLHIILTGVILGATLWFTIVKFTFDSLIICMGYFSIIVCVGIGGQRLMDASESVADYVYSTNWYDLELKLQKALILIIVRSRKPLFVTAADFTIMNYAIIIGAIKTAYSFITLLTNY